MMITRKAIARRTVLRGIGATIALPLLDGMVPALSALARTPAAPSQRFGFIYIVCATGKSAEEMLAPEERILFERIFSVIITESLALNAMPHDVRKVCRLAGIGSKSVLLQIARQGDAQKMLADCLAMHARNPERLRDGDKFN